MLPDFYSNVVWHPERGIPIYRGLTNDFFEQRKDSLEKKKALLLKLHDAGAELRLGTDTQQPFVVPGAGLHTELGLFAEAGIPVKDIWEYATADAGESLGLENLGLLIDGAPADFLIFREDPTENLDALDSLEAVVVRGKLFTVQALEAKQEEYQKHYESFPLKQLSKIFAQRAVDKAAANFTN